MFEKETEVINTHYSILILEYSVFLIILTLTS